MQIYVYYDRAARTWVARYPRGAGPTDPDAITARGQTPREAKAACRQEHDLAHALFLQDVDAQVAEWQSMLEEIDAYMAERQSALGTAEPKEGKK